MVDSLGFNLAPLVHIYQKMKVPLIVINVHRASGLSNVCSG